MQHCRVIDRQSRRPGSGGRLSRNDRLEGIPIGGHGCADIEDDAGDSITVVLNTSYLNRVGVNDGRWIQGGYLCIRCSRGRIWCRGGILKKISGVVEAETTACCDTDTHPGIVARHGIYIRVEAQNI